MQLQDLIDSLARVASIGFSEFIQNLDRLVVQQNLSAVHTSMTIEAPPQSLHYGFGMSHKFKQAICNEVYEKRPFKDVAKSIRRIGYDGIEIAPFTLAEKPSDISAA